MSDRLQLAENVNQRSMVEDYLNRVQIEPAINADKIAELQQQIKQQLIEKAMSVTSGQVIEAAKLLDISRNALYRRLEKFGIKYES